VANIGTAAQAVTITQTAMKKRQTMTRETDEVSEDETGDASSSRVQPGGTAVLVAAGGNGERGDSIGFTSRFGRS